MNPAVILGSLIFLNVLFLIKNFITHKTITKVIHAIRDYNIAIINSATNFEELHSSKVQFEDMRKYSSILFDLTSWTTRGVLSPEKYELIKPYIAK